MTSMTCDSVCCMRGKAWNSRWLMMQLTNDQHACVLVFVPILNIPCDCKFVFSVLDELYVSHHAWCSGILRVHYKTMKCDVSFSQGSVSALFRRGEHVFHVRVTCSSCLQQCKNYKNQTSFSRVMVTNIFYESQCRYFVRGNIPCNSQHLIDPQSVAYPGFHFAV